MYTAKNNLYINQVKTKVREDKVDEIEEKIAKKLCEAHRIVVEKELDEIRDAKKKGRCAVVFKLKAKVTGEKKEAAEAMAIKDPVTGDMIYESDEIRNASLKYCKTLLKDKKPDDDYALDVKVRELLHDARMSELVENDEHEDFTIEVFTNMMDKLKKKSQAKYKYILQAGKSFKDALFRMFRNVWEQERRPSQWKSTTIIQLYKGKGESDDLGNHRNIHLKEDIPKAFETAVVDSSKPKIVSKCSNFQIGGMPGHRPSEHLFCIKSMMALYQQLDIPLIIQTFDISKYFDSEVLRNALGALYDAGVSGKLYRLWFELNKETEIKVKTGAGMSRTTIVGETVAQGSIGGALVSSLNLDGEVNHFFSGSINEAAYSDVRLQPLILQDDLCRMSCSADSARAAMRRMENIMKLQQLDINVTKSSFIVCQNSTKSDEIKKELENNPLRYDGTKVKEKQNEKYLGDMIDGRGLKESIEATLSERSGRISGSIMEIRTILDDYRSSQAGGIMAGIMLWEMAVIPSFINNSETWICIGEDSLKKMEELQCMLLRSILSTAKSTPKALLYWDTGVLPMAYRVEKNKLLFLHHLITLPESSLAKQIYDQQKQNNFPGLILECKELMKKYDVEDITEAKSIPTKTAWKKMVQSKVKDFYQTELIKEIKEKYSKLEDIDTENEKFEPKEYLKELDLSQARIKFKLRSRMIEVKNNFKRGQQNENLECQGCQISIDTQDHILFCPFFSDLRQDLDLGQDSDLLKYCKEVMEIREKMKKRKI